VGQVESMPVDALAETEVELSAAAQTATNRRTRCHWARHLVVERRRVLGRRRMKPPDPTLELSKWTIFLCAAPPKQTMFGR
jgi:hypothetical protein